MVEESTTRVENRLLSVCAAPSQCADLERIVIEKQRSSVKIHSGEPSKTIFLKL